MSEHSGEGDPLPPARAPLHARSLERRLPRRLAPLFVALLGLAWLPAVARAAPPTADEERLYDLSTDYQFDESIALAERLIASEPRAQFAHRARLYAWFADPLRDLEAALAPYRERATADPSDPLAVSVLLYGESLLAQRLPDSEERKREYERLRDRTAELIRRWPEHPDLRSLQARVLLLLGSNREAGEAQGRAIERDPKNVLHRIAPPAAHLPSDRLEPNRRWLDAYAARRAATPITRAIELERLERIDSEAERALRLEALLPSFVGTRHEDDLRLRLAQLDRRADDHLAAIRALGFCNRYAEALVLAAERARGQEGVWSWFSAKEVRKQNLGKAIDLLRDAEADFRAVPGELLAARAGFHYQLEEYEEARACVARLADLGKRESRRAADQLSLVGDSFHAERRYAEAREAYDRALEGNAAFPFPSRLRHLECMVRIYPLLAIAQGSSLFLLLLAAFLSVALTAARLGYARRYFKLAALPALLVTALELSLYLRSTSGWGTGPAMVTVVGFLKNFFLLVSGMVLAARGGCRPFTPLRDVARFVRTGDGRAWVRRAPRRLGAMVAAWAVLLGLTFAFVRLFNPHVNESVSVAKSLDTPAERQEARRMESDAVAEATLLAVAAAMEEVLFRWFLFGLFQSYLRRFRWSVPFAVALTAVLWGLGHLGGVDPWWYRMVQTTSAGLVLGWLRWRHGVESSFLVHTAFNWTQMLLARGLS